VDRIRELQVSVVVFDFFVLIGSKSCRLLAYAFHVCGRWDPQTLSPQLMLHGALFHRFSTGSLLLSDIILETLSPGTFALINGI
jgi:hypothetical protein